MFNLHTESGLYLYTRYEDMKDRTKCRKYGGLGGYGEL